MCLSCTRSSRLFAFGTKLVNNISKSPVPSHLPTCVIHMNELQTHTCGKVGVLSSLTKHVNFIFMMHYEHH